MSIWVYIFVQDLTPHLNKLSPALSSVYLLATSGHKKGISAMIRHLESILSTYVTFFESIPFFTSTSTDQFVPSLHLPLHVSTTEIEQILVPRTEVEKMPSKKLLLVFSHHHKVPSPSSLPPTSDFSSCNPQHLQHFSLFISDLSITLQKGKLYIITHHISRFVSYENLTQYFVSLPFLFLLFLYPDHLRKQC